MIIGLTGSYAAGKGTAAEALMALGFAYHSLSDVIRDELAERGIPEGREALLEMGNELRQAGGPAALARRLARKLADGGDHIVDSIRNPAEVVALRELPQFLLIGIDADARLRFDRLLARARQGDPTTWERFVELESREVASSDPKAQQLAATWALRDVTLSNDGGVEGLHAAVQALVAERRSDAAAETAASAGE